MRTFITPCIFCWACFASCSQEPSPSNSKAKQDQLESKSTKQPKEIEDPKWSAPREEASTDPLPAHQKIPSENGKETLPFGISKEMFEAQPRRFQSEIRGMQNLPEKVPLEWFQTKSEFVQVNVLRGNFIWGKFQDTVLLGLKDEEGEFITWPESRILEIGQRPSISKKFFGYPVMPNTFGEVPLKKSF